MGRSASTAPEGKSATVTWSALFGVFLLSHLVGDFVLQTDWQASNKQHGLRGGGPTNRRALLMHGLVYTLAFVPALVWVADESGTLAAIAVGAAVWIPHMVVDDGNLVAMWIRQVKHVQGVPSTVVRLGVDQSTHVLTLALVAYIVTG
jgi:hypothetical protein